MPEFGAEPVLWHWDSGHSPLLCPAREVGTRACGSALGMPALGVASHSALIVPAARENHTLALGESTLCSAALSTLLLGLRTESNERPLFFLSTPFRIFLASQEGAWEKYCLLSNEDEPP